MVEYRAYSIGLDGHFISFEAIISASDEEAIEKAQRYVDGHDNELWCGDRLVTRINHKPK
jgi:hypothetical protein